jgi:DNA replication protein DnaC
MLTSNRPVEDWGKLLGDTPAVTAMLDRLLEHDAAFGPSAAGVRQVN